MSESPFIPPEDMPFNEESVRELSQGIMMSNLGSVVDSNLGSVVDNNNNIGLSSSMLVDIQNMSDAQLSRHAISQLFCLTNSLIPVIKNLGPLLEQLINKISDSPPLLLPRRQREEKIDVDDERPKKRSKSSNVDPLLVPADEVFAIQHDLVFVMSFLMTMEGLSCISLVEFNKSWIVILNPPKLAKLLSMRLRKKDGSFQFTRRQKKNNRFCQAELSTLLKYHISQLSPKPYMTTCQQKWPELKQDKMLAFQGDVWMKRWLSLFERNHAQMTHWRSEMEIFNPEDMIMESDTLLDVEKKAWMRFHSKYPLGAYEVVSSTNNASEGNTSSSSNYNRTFQIGFGWTVQFQ